MRKIGFSSFKVFKNFSWKLLSSQFFSNDSFETIAKVKLVIGFFEKKDRQFFEIFNAPRKHTENKASKHNVLVLRTHFFSSFHQNIVQNIPINSPSK